MHKINYSRFPIHSLAVVLAACQAGAAGCGETSDLPGSSGSSTTMLPDLPVPPRATETGETTGSSEVPSTPTDPDTPTTLGTSETGMTGMTGMTTTGADLPAPVVLDLSFSPIKRFDFSWTPAAGAEYYQILEKLEDGADYKVLRDNLVGTSVTLIMPLHLRWGASYIVQACNGDGCTDSEPVKVVDSLTDAVGYFKASNTRKDDIFGDTVALSADGDTLAVGAPEEDSGAGGTYAFEAGAIYVFVRIDGTWSQQAVVKASAPHGGDFFGMSVALSADGRTLAVGAPFHDGGAAGINGDEADESRPGAGAAFVFTRAHGTWSQQAYVKASNPEAGDFFGTSVALSADGDTLAVGAGREDSGASGIGGDQADESRDSAGAVYVFVRDDGAWAQQAYVKASKPGTGDIFGYAVALSADGNTLAVGAPWEGGPGSAWGGGGIGVVYTFRRQDGGWSQQDYIKAANDEVDDMFGYAIALSADGTTLVVGAPWEGSDATGIDGDQADNSARYAGAVYVFMYEGYTWSQQAYIKASNTAGHDEFGSSVGLSADGTVLAVGAPGEDSIATGINGDQADDSASEAGAVYVFVRAVSPGRSGPTSRPPTPTHTRASAATTSSGMPSPCRPTDTRSPWGPAMNRAPPPESAAIRPTGPQIVQGPSICTDQRDSGATSALVPTIPSVAASSSACSASARP